MTINLANVNISIQQFQKISSGKYNAGEVRLTGRTSLGMVNNHISKIEKNTVQLSHEEVIAVKTAFIKALRDGGVNSEEILRVRAQLGLATAEGDAVDRTLEERSLKPLTRQQVRVILDRNAATINATLGAGTIRKSENQPVDWTAHRDQVNNALETSWRERVSANNDVMLFERLAAGNLTKLTEEDCDRMLQMARQELDAARGKYGDNPPANNMHSVTCRLPGGQEFEVSTRKSTAEFIAYLEDLIFTLSTPQPADDFGIIPPHTDRNWNRALMTSLLSAQPKPLPHDIAALEKELLAEARAKFGADTIPPNARLRDLIHGEIASSFNRIAEAAGGRRLGAEDLRAHLRGALVRYGAMMLAGKRLEQEATACGVKSVTNAAKRSFIARNPDLLAAIEQANSPADIGRILDDARPAFAKMASLLLRIESNMATCCNRAANAIAAKSGLPAAALGTLPCVLGFKSKFAESLASKLTVGQEVVCETEKDVDDAFDAAIETFSKSLPTELAKAEAVFKAKNISPTAAQAIRAMLCQHAKFSPDVFDIEKFPGLVEKLKPSFNALLNALRDPKYSKENGFDAMEFFTKLALTEIGKLFPGIDDQDERLNALHTVILLALNGDFEAAAPLKTFLERADVAKAISGNKNVSILNTSLLAVGIQLDPKMANEALLTVLGTPRTPPYHAAMLIKAARDAGLTATSEADILALFTPDKPAGKALATAIKASQATVTPQLLQNLAADALLPFGEAIHDGVASAALSATETEFPPEARANATLAYEKAGAEPWKADALVAAAFEACGNDADTRAIVLANLDKILVGGNANLRTAEKVREQVEALKANFEELRKLGAAEQNLIAQGRELLASLHGTPLPAGFLGKLVQSSWEQPTGALKGLSARSKGLAIHKAIAALRRNFERVLVEAGVLQVLPGADQLTACKEFLVRRMLSTLSQADLAGLRAALHSQNAAKLISAYGDPQSLLAHSELSNGLRNTASATANLLRLQAYELNETLCTHLGIQEEAIPQLNGPAPRPADFGANGLAEDIVSLSRERQSIETKLVVNRYVNGDSPTAKKVRDAFTTKLGPEPATPESTLMDEFKTNVGTMLNRALLLDMQGFANGGQTQFDKDRNRQVKVVLADIGEVSTDPVVARDQFAQFVTGNPAATYDSLDQRMRNKANFAMSFASQGTNNALALGYGVMLDPNGQKPAVTFSGPVPERTFTMEFDANGGLSVHFIVRQNPIVIALLDGNIATCDPGSEVKMTLDIHVNPQEMTRIADLDVTAYDDRPVSQIIDVQKPKNMFHLAKTTFPEAFRLQMDLTPTTVADLK